MIFSEFTIFDFFKKTKKSKEEEKIEEIVDKKEPDLEAERIAKIRMDRMCRRLKRL